MATEKVATEKVVKKKVVKKKHNTNKNKTIKQFDRRHELLADEILKDAAEGKRRSGRELLEQVGYSKDTAETQVQRTLTSKSLRKCLVDRGLDEDRMRRVLDDALGANTVVVFKGKATESDVPDHKIRLTAVDRLAEVFGVKKTVVEHRNLNVNVDGDQLLKALGIES